MEKSTIKQILVDQKEEINKILQGKLIIREIADKAQKLFDSDLVKVIMGVRRCGKSVLAHQLLKGKNYGYINFDDERLLGVKAKDLNNFLETIKEMEPDCTTLFLDEIQNVLGWELFVNRLKRAGYNIIVSGSNSHLLSKELATHLTGRYVSFELYPFSFKEFLWLKDFSFSEESFLSTERRAGIKRFLTEYLTLGGFPEVFKTPLPEDYLRELFDKIITRDIILRYNVKYARDLKEIALFALSNFSSKLSFHKVKNIFDVKSVHTAKNYLGYLEEAYLLFQICAFSFKQKERIKMPRKIYGIDIGIINSIVPRITIDQGKLIENAVFLELRRRRQEVFYYSQPAYEVDFVIRQGVTASNLIQVCYSLPDADTRNREINALIKAASELKCKDLTIICWDEEGEEKYDSKRIKIVPLWKWLLLPS